KMQQQLAVAGVGFDQVVRTWLYVNQITAGEEGGQRYQELNRARTDFYGGIHLCARNRAGCAPETIYPASTGIGTGGADITMSCMAVDLRGPDVFLMAVGNRDAAGACQCQRNDVTQCQ